MTDLSAHLKGLKTFARQHKEYVNISNIVLSTLEWLDDDCPYKEMRADTITEHDYFESSIEYDNYCEIIVDEARQGIPIQLNCEQLKAMLKLKHMIRKFDFIMQKIDFPPTDYLAQQEIILNHPQWKRMSRQAHKILDLLRIKNS